MNLKNYIRSCNRVIAITDYQFLFKKLDNGMLSVILTDGLSAIGLNSRSRDDIKDFFLKYKEKILKKCNQF